MTADHDATTPMPAATSSVLEVNPQAGTDELEDITVDVLPEVEELEAEEHGGEAVAKEERLVFTGNLAVDLITETERWRRRRRIGFESWRYRLVFEGGRNDNAPDHRTIDVLRLIYDLHVAYETRYGWRKPFQADALHLTAATIAARLNLKKETVQGVLRRLKAKGLITKELRKGKYPYLTPDPVRVAEITFPVETEADPFHVVRPVLRVDDSALLNLVLKRPEEVGCCTGVHPQNLYNDLRRLEPVRPWSASESVPAQTVSVPPSSRPSWSPHRAGSSAHSPGEVLSSVALPGVATNGGGETPYREGEGPDSDGRPDTGAVSSFDALEALVALYVGVEVSDEEEAELTAIADTYPFRERPHPLEEAYRAHRTVQWSATSPTRSGKPASGLKPSTRPRA